MYRTIFWKKKEQKKKQQTKTKSTDWEKFSRSKFNAFLTNLMGENSIKFAPVEIKGICLKKYVFWTF